MKLKQQFHRNKRYCELTVSPAHLPPKSDIKTVGKKQIQSISSIDHELQFIHQTDCYAPFRQLFGLSEALDPLLFSQPYFGQRFVIKRSKLYLSSTFPSIAQHKKKLVKRIYCFIRNNNERSNFRREGLESLP